MWIKPKTDYKIFDPLRKDRLPPEGREVDPNNIYWSTLLRDGDVVQAAPPADPYKSSEPEA